MNCDRGLFEALTATKSSTFGRGPRNINIASRISCDPVSDIGAGATPSVCPVESNTDFNLNDGTCEKHEEKKIPRRRSMYFLLYVAPDATSKMLLDPYRKKLRYRGRKNISSLPARLDGLEYRC
jgi:hypothetical protein